MEDSPLSITASVTGILTFIAAILAFIYVRYSVLENGYTEMSTILMSVKSSIEDTQMMQTTNLDDTLGKLLSELYQLEVEIISEVVKAMNLHEVEQAAPTTDGRCRQIGIMKPYFKVVDFNPEYAALLWGCIRFVFTLGLTPMLFRWYLVREKVFKMTHRRETLRSRILFYQMCLVHSRSSSQDHSIHRLREETNLLRDLLAEMRAYVKQITKSKDINGDREHLAS